MLAYYLRTGGVLASLQAGACAVGGGLGSSTTSALRGAGAAVLSAHARPYSPEPGDTASHGSNDKAEFQERLEQAVKRMEGVMQGQAKQLEALAAGTTEYQKAQAKQLEALMAGTSVYQKAQAKQLEALMAGTSVYQKAQAKQLEALMAGTSVYQKAQAKQLEALMAGTSVYQKKQATDISSLVEWRTTVLAFAKFTSFLVLAGGAYIKLFT